MSLRRALLVAALALAVGMLVVGNILAIQAGDLFVADAGGMSVFVNAIGLLVLSAVGVGVIIDWVPAHFPSDAHGLGRFDGTALYEHADPRQGFHQDWNTLIYNFGRQEVANFLQASALYWLDRFHIDALRVDAVASMLYLDYSRKEGEWIPNEYGGNENLEAIAFLRRMNEILYEKFPNATTIEAMKEARKGKLPRFATVNDLMADLHAAD